MSDWFKGLQIGLGVYLRGPGGEGAINGEYRGERGYLGLGKFGTKWRSFSFVRKCCLIFVMQLHLTQYYHSDKKHFLFNQAWRIYRPLSRISLVPNSPTPLYGVLDFVVSAQSSMSPGNHDDGGSGGVYVQVSSNVSRRSVGFKTNRFAIFCRQWNDQHPSPNGRRHSHSWLSLSGWGKKYRAFPSLSSSFSASPLLIFFPPLVSSSSPLILFSF